METPILSIKNLHKRYGKVHAVNDVSLEIQKGNVYGILGPNGSGKSTTLGIVLNVVNKTSGEYSWFGGTQETHEALKKVGAIIERPNFYPYMTAKENLELVCKIKGINYSKIEEKLEIVGLTDRKNSKFKTYSLGMKQRLAIASALLNDPEILILDEPTNGLDPQGIIQIRDIIRLIASQGTTILLASHLLDEVEKVCSHVLVLRFGKILYNGKVDEMTTKGGYFELQSNSNDRLIDLIKNNFSVEKISENDGKVIVHFNQEVEASNLNKFLIQQNIYLSHLVKRKSSLEEQFLELTNNN
ncbi:ABC transporter ATP-binding protein [Flavobacterium capsici]|uniref:ATP-binding cassette domain-containing protein n=1 Tax=Flavobacterium capsici TaxID=3075618 RepID=A0AA96F0D2_9FLAO|nr:MULTISPECIES: ATP-binding cassette domain-containing protein [unclassified Flavobacterium]WNM20312.1 ATP-binding cassette domain-containing protein [Flavobacterium sp. PMR2A8]WNM21702.1 ATP-binding cassette domain-containing protein [Flavobacterium sp. PMTSA4]